MTNDAISKLENIKITQVETGIDILIDLGEYLMKEFCHQNMIDEMLYQEANGTPVDTEHGTDIFTRFADWVTRMVSAINAYFVRKKVLKLYDKLNKDYRLDQAHADALIEARFPDARWLDDFERNAVIIHEYARSYNEMISNQTELQYFLTHDGSATGSSIASLPKRYKKMKDTDDPSTHNPNFTATIPNKIPDQSRHIKEIVDDLNDRFKEVNNAFTYYSDSTNVNINHGKKPGSTRRVDYDEFVGKLTEFRDIAHGLSDTIRELNQRAKDLKAGLKSLGSLSGDDAKNAKHRKEVFMYIVTNIMRGLLTECKIMAMIMTWIQLSFRVAPTDNGNDTDPALSALVGEKV